MTKIKIFIKQLEKLSFENYPSILQIKQNICSNSFHAKEKICFHFANEIEIKKLIQGLNPRKATGIDTITTKTDKSSRGIFDSTFN